VDAEGQQVLGQVQCMQLGSCGSPGGNMASEHASREKGASVVCTLLALAPPSYDWIRFLTCGSPGPGPKAPKR
jgi:hypothetical protein